MRKNVIIPILVSLFLLLFSVISASADDLIRVSLSEETAERGEDVSVTVSIADNPGISFADLGFSYDDTRLEYVGFEGLGEDFATAKWVEGSDGFQWENMNQNSSYNGEILMLNFRVLDDAPAGDAVVAIEGKEAGSFNQFVGSGEVDGIIIAAEYQPGKVTVPGAASDDVIRVSVSEETASRGEDVSVTVSIADNPGISFIDVGFGYDDTRLEYVGFEGLGEEFATDKWVEGSDGFQWENMNQNSSYNGEILMLNFRVLDNATAGDAAVAIEGKEAGSFNQYVGSGEQDGIIIEAEYQPGKVTVTAEESDDVIRVSVSEETASRGEDVSVTVSIADNPGISFADLGFSYDETRLEYVGFEGLGEDFATEKWVEGSDGFQWENMNQNTSYNGEILMLNFRVLDDAPAGDAVVAIEGKEAGSFNQYVGSGDQDGIIIEAEYQPGKVTVEINDDGPVQPESVQLDQESVMLQEGDTLQLTASVLPEEAEDKAVTWESSDPDVAVVDEDGFVTAVSKGRATITATSNADTSLSGSCEITVTAENEILPESMSLNDPVPTELTQGETAQVSATILPEDADDKGILWESSDPGVATVDRNGVITAVGEGTATITGIASGDPSIRVSFSITVKGKKAQPQQAQPQRPENIFWRLGKNDILPRTGFSAVRPQPIAQKPLDISYKPLRWSIEIPSADAKADIVEVPFVDGEYPVTWLGDAVGLLEDTALPGNGRSVLIGHNHLNTMEAGPFAFLEWLEEGTRIFVHDPKNRVTIYVVYANEKVSETDIEAVEAIAAAFENSITMITCEDERTDGGYASRRIVAARPN